MYEHLHDHHRWVLPQVLESQARLRGAQPFIEVVGGESVTYAEAAAQARQVAGYLHGLGVRAGDRVAVLLPNGTDFIRLWTGLGRLGAVIVPVNTALTGDFLAHQLRDSGAAVAVCDPDTACRLDAAATQVPALTTLLVADRTVASGPTAPSPDVEAGPPPGGRFHVLPLDGWRTAAAFGGPLPRASDTACVMYTSGTTGPSKGVLMPHAHCYLFALGTVENLQVTESDRYYVTMPLFHANGLFMQVYATLVAGASALLRPRFSASAWLPDIREGGCTVTNLLGAMTQFVIAQPESAQDREHRLRVVCPVPNPPHHEEAFRGRFGVPEVVSAYGMTEVNIPLYGRIGASRPGTAGLAWTDHFEVEIRDPETDDVVPPGTPGEIVVRPRTPFGFMSGYLGLPEKTVEAWRNFWFHTGDSGVMDDDGWVTFVDRTKDCIRRRGENISSFEVEAAIAQLPGVLEVAAFAVPAGVDGMEDEVMLAVVVDQGSGLDGPAIAAHADAALPRFARPRYVDVVESIPKTPTAKVQKQLLRSRGVTPSAWDRES